MHGLGRAAERHNPQASTPVRVRSRVFGNCTVTGSINNPSAFTLVGMLQLVVIEFGIGATLFAARPLPRSARGAYSDRKYRDALQGRRSSARSLCVMRDTNDDDIVMNYSSSNLFRKARYSRQCAAADSANRDICDVGQDRRCRMAYGDVQWN